MLNISKQIYVGWSTEVHTLPDVEITPVGTATNEKNKVKKLATKFTNTKEYSNDPLPGFTLIESQSRGWSSRETDWLVIDPRGFICRITSDNLTNLLAVTGITEGLIQEKCVWARNDSETKLSLIPVNAPEYQEAVENTDLIDNRVSKSDIKYGDTVLLQNGLTGRYMGTESLYGPAEYTYSYYSGNAGVPKSWCRRQIIEVKTGLFFFGTNIKILKIVEAAEKPMTRAEALKYMNEQIAVGAYFSKDASDDGTVGWSRPGRVKMVSSYGVKPALSFEEIDATEAAAIYQRAYKAGDRYQLVVEDSYRSMFLIDMPYRGSGAATVPAEFLPEPLSGIDPTSENVILSRGRSRFNNYGSKVTKRKLDDFVKFYKIVKHVKTDSYV